MSMQLLSEGWTGVGGVNEGPADDGAAVAFPPLDVVGICSMTTTFIRLPLMEGRRWSPFFFNLPIFARAVLHTSGTRSRGRRTLTVYGIVWSCDCDDTRHDTATRRTTRAAMTRARPRYQLSIARNTVAGGSITRGARYQWIIIM